MTKCDSFSITLREIENLELAIRKLRIAICGLEFEEDSLMASAVSDTLDNLRALEVSLKGDGQPALRAFLVCP